MWCGGALSSIGRCHSNQRNLQGERWGKWLYRRFWFRVVFHCRRMGQFWMLWDGWKRNETGSWTDHLNQIGVQFLNPESGWCYRGRMLLCFQGRSRHKCQKLCLHLAETQEWLELGQKEFSETVYFLGQHLQQHWTVRGWTDGGESLRTLLLNCLGSFWSVSAVFRSLRGCRTRLWFVRTCLFYVGVSVFGIWGVEGRVMQSTAVGFQTAVGRGAVFFSNGSDQDSWNRDTNFELALSDFG